MTNVRPIEFVHALQECRDVCLETLSMHCMKMGGDHMAHEHLRRMESTIELCGLTADFILRHAPLTQELTDLCADVCKQCATSCGGFGDPHMSCCMHACELAAQACLAESYRLRTATA